MCRWLIFYGSALILTTVSIAAVWEERSSTHCRVYFHSGDESNVTGVIQTVAAALPEIEEKLGVTFAGTIQVYLSSNQPEFDQLTGGTLPKWSQGVSFPQNGVIVLKSASFSHDIATCNRTAVHELVHLLLALKAGPRVPRWLGEGLALLLSREGTEKSRLPIARALWSDKMILLHDVEAVDSFSGERAELAYLESQQAVEFFTRQYGWDTLRQVLSAMGGGLSWNDALSRGISLDQASFEAEWQKSIRGAYRWMILQDLSFYLFPGAALLVLIAGFVIMRRNRRTYRKWEAEEESEQSTF